MSYWDLLSRHRLRYPAHGRCWFCCRIVRGMACSLEEPLVYAAIRLAHFTAPFDASAAAQMLNCARSVAKARGMLAALTRVGLLTSHGKGEGQMWSMHACIRDGACIVAEELGIHCLAAK